MKFARAMRTCCPTMIRLNCMIALIIALSHCVVNCLQVMQVSSNADSPGSAVITAIQQQQQQQQSAPKQTNLMSSSPENQLQSGQQGGGQAKQSAKSNHRLVSKLKDARHRRRHRHRQRQNHRPSVENAANLLADQTHHQAPSTTLTALESIVEEVARAGQMQPNGGGQQQQQQQQQPVPLQVQHNQPISTAASPTDLLLDGSSSPITRLQQPQTGQQQQQQQQHAPSTPFGASHQTGIANRAPPAYNSRGSFLTSMLSKIMNVLNVTEFALEMRDGISSRASCMACNAVVGLFLSPLYSKEVFSAAIRTVCTSFKIQSPRVCAGLVESFQDDFEFIRKNTKLTRDEVCAVVFGVDCARRQTYNLFWTVPIPDMPSSSQVGGTPNQQTQLDSTKSSSNSANNGLTIPLNEQSLTNMEDAPDLFEYRKSNAPQKQQKQQSEASKQQVSTGVGGIISSAESSQAPQPAKAADQQQQQQQQIPTAAANKAGKMLKQRPEYIFDDEHLLADNEQAASERQNKISTFVHITDIHVDPYYEAGSLNDCSEPLCCRASSGPVPVNDKRRQAGRWGDYGNCDTPVRTVHSALNRIREQHSNAEYWLWTGDISPHDIWNISKSEAANNVRLVSKMVRDYSNGLPVFPVIGNHEAHPVNSFSPPEIKGKFSMSWLYDLLADEWSDWLPKDALKTLRFGGFYKLQLRKGFRIIALNTNYCARLNPWSFYDPVDPASQLKWLVDELLEAELNQDKVHIIGHVPPDNRECTQAWLFNFINIVDRFKDTIVAQFYGHTHRDEWRIIYSMRKSEEPIGIQYIGPSITPFTENNPAYRVYHQDRAGYLIDSETYYFNLTEANELPADEGPNWKFSYRTRTHLNMTQGLNPVEWHQYLERLHSDDELFDSFFKNYYRFSDVKSGQTCRAKCKYQILSDLRLSHPYKTKPKPFLANRKTSNHHHRDHHHHHHHHKRLRHSE